MKTNLLSGLLFLGLFSSVSPGQLPAKKDDLTIEDRAGWRKILKWPDDCEKGFREYQQHSPPGGIGFHRLGTNAYLVDVGCSGSLVIFMYYREESKSPARLLKFREYDSSHGQRTAPYSKVYFLTYSFDRKGNVLWIYSKTSDESVCLMHKYTFRRGRPVFLRTKKEHCSDVVQAPPNKALQLTAR
jgi:hypothetical protein